MTFPERKRSMNFVRSFCRDDRFLRDNMRYFFVDISAFITQASVKGVPSCRCCRT